MTELLSRLRARMRLRRTTRRLLASGLFDVEHYLAQSPDVPPTPRAAVEHYVRHGSREGRNPNPYFDVQWYLRTYQDVLDSGFDPLLHYLVSGAAEGRDPSPAFSTSRYLSRHPEVHGNPLVHFLHAGQHRGLQPDPVQGQRGLASRPAPTVPSEQEWAAARPAAAESDVVIVVPVYRGRAETLRCLLSVLTDSSETRASLLVVDDATPEPELAADLRDLERRGLLRLLVNSKNQGFVRSANRGLRDAGPRDVVLLNSDTQVYGNWLDRLRAAAHGNGRTGTVTPWSDAGSVVSYPDATGRNDAQLELDNADLDALVGAVFAGETAPIPSCVGFCVYLRRDCLDEIGLLDEDAFGLGYGEENDLSLRAQAAGWENVLAADVFVHHVGGVSFGTTSSGRRRAALEVLRERYPHYPALVRDHVLRNQLGELRRRLDQARLDRARGGRSSVVLWTHALGGGTGRHVTDLAARWDDVGVMPVIVRPAGAGRVLLSSPALRHAPNLEFDWPAELSVLASIFDLLHVRHVHVHHLQGYGAGAARLVPELVDRLGIAYDVTVHDWMTVCPRVDMVDGSERWCGGPAVGKCSACVRRNGTPFGQVDVVEWQAEHASLLAGARCVFVPTPDATRHLPSCNLVVRPHPDSGDRPEPLALRAPDDEMLHVALLGAVGRNKGSRILAALARDVSDRRLPLKFHVIGHTEDDAQLRALGVEITGRYEPDELSALVIASGCSVALLPSVTPETYSYTLSEAWDLGLYPVSFDLGALAARIREEAHGLVLPWHLVDAPSAVNDALLRLTPSPPHLRSSPQYTDLLSDYYDLCLPDRRVESAEPGSTAR